MNFLLLFKDSNSIYCFRKAIQVLGESTFQKVYTYYVEQRTAQKTNPDLNEAKIAQGLAGLTQRPNDCFLVDQLVFLELN